MPPEHVWRGQEPLSSRTRKALGHRTLASLWYIGWSTNTNPLRPDLRIRYLRSRIDVQDRSPTSSREMHSGI